MYKISLRPVSVYGRIDGMKKERRRIWTPPYAVLEGKLRAVAAESAPGDSLGTEVAIAREHGVSRMTARKAVNALVAEGLVERRAGVGLFIRREESITRRFRVVAGNLLWDVAMKIASGVRREALEHGADIELRDAGGDMRAFLREIRALPGSGVAGAVILSTHDSRLESALKGLKSAGFPFAVADRVPRDDGVPSSVSDNIAGGRLVADELADAGHESLAFLGDIASDTVAVRWQGFAERCSERGLAEPDCFDIAKVGRFESWEAEICRQVRGLLAKRRRPTGLFCSCDAVARFAMRALEAGGLSVPRDMSVVGFDNDPIAEWTTPSLTTVAQDFHAIGSAAVRALLARLSNPGGEAASETVPIGLVRRGSVAARQISD